MVSGFNPQSVSSVAGKTGTVVLNASDIIQTATGLRVIAGNVPGASFGEFNATEQALANNFIFRDSSGRAAVSVNAYTTAGRPPVGVTVPGTMIVDTTLNKPIFNIDGVNWRDASGAIV